MALKLKKEFGMVLSMTNLMEDDVNVVFELSMFVFNIKKLVCDVLDSFFSFLMKYEEKNIHNMFSLILNPKFKSLKLVSSFKI
jgi:hypothetical protein